MFKIKNFLFVTALCMLFLWMGCRSNGLKIDQLVPQRILDGSDSFSTAFLQVHNKESEDYKMAATFLLNDLRYHYFMLGSKDSAYTGLINRYCDTGYILRNKLDSIKQVSFPPGGLSYDADVITASYLDSNIRSSLLAYNKSPWKREVSFNTFCEYILPYRIGEEILIKDNWRRNYVDSFLLHNDSLAKTTRLQDAAKLVHDYLRAKYRPFHLRFGRASLNLGDLPLTIIKKLNTGTCHELSGVSIATLRCLGIPACLDFTPNYVNLNSGHEWSAIVKDSMHCIPFDISSDSMQKYKQNVYTLAKVYRYGFKLNKKGHVFMKGFDSDLPDCFNNPFITDVTTSYIPTSRINVPFNKPASVTDDFVYLAVFNRPNWVPVDWGMLDGDSARFNNIGRGGMYVPFVIDKKADRNYYGNAILLKNDGAVHQMIPDTVHRRSVHLTRKYPTFIVNNGYFISRTMGGKFQGANRPDFKDAKDLFVINSNPRDTINIVPLSGLEKYQYIRYYSPKGSYGNMSEVEFYTTDSGNVSLLKGTVIGTAGSYQDNPLHTREALFDDNYVTFFDSKQADSSWAGLALDEKKTISEIRFIARNDLNGIDKESVYELYYWDRKWISLGKKGGVNNVLTYDNVPGNALLWLRNQSVGVEERIFTYENDRQVWW